MSIGNEEITIIHSTSSVAALILVDKLSSYITLKNKKIKVHLNKMNLNPINQTLKFLVLQ